MQSKHASLISFLIVIGIHAGVLAAVISWPSTATKPVELVIPTIQGVLVMAQPEQAPPPPPEPAPPPPEKKPAPKPAPKPLPKAPPAERAVKAPEPEPAPQAETPAEPTPAAPAPAPVVPPRAEAGQLSNPAPVYPSLSRRLREEGTVVLDILIKADGTVGEVNIKRSSGFKRLDETAAKAVSQWRYSPATQGDRKIDFWYEQPVEFYLN